MRYLLLTLWLVSFGLNGLSADCPDYNTPSNPPAFTKPAKRNFRNFGNTILSGLFVPYHMVFDSIVRSGSSATIVGKFDYDAVLHKDLEGEYIHVYIYGTGLSGWNYVGRYTTNGDGKITANLGVRATGDYIVRMVVEGDLSSTDGYLTVADPGRQTVLFDVDGTLTTNDFEAIADYTGIKIADAYYYAPETVNAYRNKGYQIVYLTGRPYWNTKDTREWFPLKGMKSWHYHPHSDALGANVQGYKTDYISYLRNTVGLDIIRAYGNATTDIGAYAAGGIPKADTWIIGEHAGKEGTQAITGNYSLHYNTVVASTPQSASCY
ncbi:lipin/Ned1/Smp2 family protein [Leptospira sarikeiensis]|uniref:Haloacid dehalogenase n=1 Tax=Leptospira sarikeiensis TaxID=2484943 RepID=A0A4R9KCE4_9LEPT|nr:haloacid dehalogenase [Leptospira sarikeiensis]TGL64589.1 haloacid dehalogenase [Leptospira sarikeiensis]